MTLRAIPLAALALAGCATPKPAFGPTGDAAGPCELARLPALAGRPGSAVLAADAMALSGAKAIRWVRPGEAVTMDYREDRLNIRLGHDGRVKGFSCG